MIVAVTFGVDVSARHAWGKYHWERASNPVALSIGRNFANSRWDTPLNEVAVDWNLSDVLNLTADPNDTRTDACAPVSGRIEVCAANYDKTGWLGIAQIWINKTHIVQATAKMNDYYFDQQYYNTAAWRRYVMCQEVGHDFGLGHQDENFNNGNLGSCMDYTNDPDGKLFSRG